MTGISEIIGLIGVINALAKTTIDWQKSRVFLAAEFDLSEEDLDTLRTTVIGDIADRIAANERAKSIEGNDKTSQWPVL